MDKAKADRVPRGKRFVPYSIQATSPAKVGEDSPIATTAAPVPGSSGKSGVKGGKKFPTLGYTCKEGPLVGSAQYYKNQEDLARFEASLKDTLLEWEDIPLLEKFRIAEDEHSRKILNIAHGDMPRFRMLLSELKEKYLRQEKESQHLLLEIFFKNLYHEALNKQFKADCLNLTAGV